MQDHQNPHRLPLESGPVTVPWPHGLQLLNNQTAPFLLIRLAAQAVRGAAIARNALPL